MKKYIVKIFLLLLPLAGFIGCETLPDATVDYAATYPISGEWWVRYNINGKDSLGLGWTKIITSNTSANVSTEIMVNGSNRLFDLTFKASSDVQQKIFSVSNSANLAVDDPSKVYFSNFTVTNGKVILKGTHSNTNVVTDSIYFELQVDDPSKLGLNANTKIIVSGKRRTGFQADDY